MRKEIQVFMLLRALYRRVHLLATSSAAPVPESTDDLCAGITDKSFLGLEEKNLLPSSHALGVHLAVFNQCSLCRLTYFLVCTFAWLCCRCAVRYARQKVPRLKDSTSAAKVRRRPSSGGSSSDGGHSRGISAHRLARPQRGKHLEHQAPVWRPREHWQQQR